jgi:hypothetical protein
MSMGEKSSDNWAADLGLEVDFITPEISPNDPLLEMIFNNFDELQTAAGFGRNLTFDQDLNNAKVTFYLDTPEYGNELKVFAISSISKHSYKIPLGYIWMGEYIIYPELLDPTNEQDTSEIMRIINDAAYYVRSEKINKYNSFDGAYQSRIDFTHPEIQLLHLEMSEFLDEDAINELLERHHEWENKAEKPHTQLYADECTRALIGVRTKKPGVGDDPAPIIEDNVIVVKIMGAYSTVGDDDIKIRQVDQYIDAAQRHPFMNTDKVSDFIEGEDYDLPDFEEGFREIHNIVPSHLLDQWVEFAQKVRELAADFDEIGIKVNKEQVGINFKPKEGFGFSG